MKLICDVDYYGAVVQSTAGRDRKRVFLVLGISDSPHQMRLAVSDGMLHSTLRPKLKNPRHVRVVAKLSDAERKILSNGPDDVTVCVLLRRYDTVLNGARQPEDENCE